MKEEFPVVNRRREPGWPPQAMHEIVCSQCPEKGLVSARNGRLPPHTVAARFQRDGWVVRDHGKHLCPACAKTRRVEVRCGGSQMLKATMTPALDDAARRALPTLYIALEDKYSREAKAYRGDATDATIAAELGLPAQIVAERRERDFGPLVENEATKRRREAGEAALKAQKALDAECDKLAAALSEARTCAAAVKAAAQALAAAERAAVGQEGRAA